MTNQQQPGPEQQPAPQIQYVQAPKKPWYKRIGCLVSIAILIIILLLFVGCTAFVGKVGSEIDKDLNAEHEITYAITGETQDATATYTVGDGQQTQETDVASGWTKTVKVKGILGASLLASNGIQGEGTVTCQILKDGVVIKENTASGPGASASCSASSDELGDS